MSTRASIILWSSGSGILLGLFIDAILIGIWTLLATALPSIAPRAHPRWAAVGSSLLLAGIPIVAGVLGYLEGRLKLD